MDELHTKSWAKVALDWLFSQTCAHIIMGRRGRALHVHLGPGPETCHYFQAQGAPQLDSKFYSKHHLYSYGKTSSNCEPMIQKELKNFQKQLKNICQCVWGNKALILEDKHNLILTMIIFYCWWNIIPWSRNVFGIFGSKHDTCLIASPRLLKFERTASNRVVQREKIWITKRARKRAFKINFQTKIIF